MKFKACEGLTGLAKDMCEIEHMTKLLGGAREEKKEKKLCTSEERLKRADKKVSKYE